MLTDAAVRAAKPRERAYKLTDSGGLVLYVAPTGSKLWRLRYSFQGKEKLLEGVLLVMSGDFSVEDGGTVFIPFGAAGYRT